MKPSERIIAIQQERQCTQSDAICAWLDEFVASFPHPADKQMAREYFVTHPLTWPSTVHITE